MSKSTTTPVATFTLAGKSAKELRDLLTAKATTKAAVIAHLSAKEGALRAPSKALLDELKGVKAAPAPAKAEAPKAPAPEKASRAVIEGLTARVAALEAALAALAPAAKAPAAKVAAAKAAKETAAKDAAKAAKAGKGK